VEAIDSVMKDDSDERDEKLGECDRRYYEVAGDLAGPLLEFIKRNKDSCGEGVASTTGSADGATRRR
jgi:hypothetical protein